MINGDKYLIDENNNVYDFETHNMVGCLDKKRKHNLCLINVI